MEKKRTGRNSRFSTEEEQRVWEEKTEIKRQKHARYLELKNERQQRMDVEEEQMRQEKEKGIHRGRLTAEQKKLRCLIWAKTRKIQKDELYRIKMETPDQSEHGLQALSDLVDEQKKIRSRVKERRRRIAKEKECEIAHLTDRSNNHPPIDIMSIKYILN